VLKGATYVGFIPVSETTAVRSFYEDTLGLVVVADTPFALVLDAGGTTVRVTPVPDFSPRPGTTAGWSVPDIEAAVRALSERGVRFNRYEGMQQDDLAIWTTPGAKVAWFDDPEGNVLSLTQST
jgi:catechol 2,3-dioxygenase-like lactoylglutathione lyase family enzyme